MYHKHKIDFGNALLTATPSLISGDTPSVYPLLRVSIHPCHTFPIKFRCVFKQKSFWLALLGLLCSAPIRVRPLMRWLALHARDTGQRLGGGGGAVALALLGLLHLARIRFRLLKCLLALRARLHCTLAAQSKDGGVQQSSLHLAYIRGDAG